MCLGRPDLPLRIRPCRMMRRLASISAGVFLVALGIFAAAPQPSSKSANPAEAARLNNLGSAYMNQQLFEPPDVAGWTLGEGWFSTGAMLARMNFASTLAANQKFNLATAAASSRGSAQAVVDFLLARLTPAPDSRADAELSAYAAAGGWSGSDPQLQAKTSGLVHLIVGSPQYQVV